MSKKYRLQCDKCKKYFNKTYKYKERNLFYHCFSIEFGGGGNRAQTLKEALSRIYEVKGVNRSFPTILIGHKIKIQLVE